MKKFWADPGGRAKGEKALLKWATRLVAAAGAAAHAESSAKKGGKKRGYMGDDTKNRVLLAAALKILGMTTYAMAPLLYPLGPRQRKAAEAATRHLLKRRAAEITEEEARMSPDRAREIRRTIHPA